MKTKPVFPIVNARRPVVLHITEEDIEASLKGRKDPAHCVIACAARREFGSEDVRIHLSRIYLRRGKKWERFMTPPSLRTELVAFDRGGNFCPGEFFLAPPQPSRQTGRRQGGNTKPNNPRHETVGVRPASTVTKRGEFDAV